AGTRLPLRALAAAPRALLLYGHDGDRDLLALGPRRTRPMAAGRIPARGERRALHGGGPHLWAEALLHPGAAVARPPLLRAQRGLRGGVMGGSSPGASADRLRGELMGLFQRADEPLPDEEFNRLAREIFAYQ